MANVPLDPPYVSRRFLTAVVVFWAVVVAVLHLTDAGDSLRMNVALPAEFRARHAVGRAPELHPRLKIFSLDDSTYAALRRPHLTGGDWARLLDALAVARPAAVITTHMFGTGEFLDENGILGETVDRLRSQGTQVVAAAFPYPGRMGFREPLSLERPEFSQPAPVLPTHLSGWTLYGTAPTDAQHFNALGHVTYDGIGRTSPFIQLTPDRVVPHLSLAASEHIRASAHIRAGNSGALPRLPAPPVDRDGRIVVDVAPLATYAARAKSLRGLLGEQAPAFATKTVDPGDTVLVLLDMYTGRVGFVSTPEGHVPNGYVVAAMLDSVLRGEWIEQVEVSGLMSVLAGLLGIFIGMRAGGRLFAAAVGVLVPAIPLVGIGSFVLLAVSVPWIPALSAFLGTAVTLYTRRIQGRLALERDRHEAAQRESAKLNAIVRTAQMFAHDVRKPFSLLNMALQSLQRQEDPKASARFIKALVPELERAMASVEGMIHDVMEIDTAARLNIETTQLEELVSDSMRQVFVIRDQAEVRISYRFEHTLAAAVDRGKVRRAMVNIIDNAVQAMDSRGRMWVSAREVVDEGQSWIEVCLGNSNSYIAPENLSKVFEAFYTHGKKGGTGLGLAIAHKVITQHGGRIWCVSTQERGTEFWFTMPVARVTPKDPEARVALPASSAEYRQGLASTAEQVAQGTDEVAAEARFVKELAEFTTRHSRGLRVLIVDDEDLYIESLKDILPEGGDAGTLELLLAKDADAAVRSARDEKPDVVFCDIDLGARSTNGFDAVDRMRKLGCRAWVVMHSNRVLPLDAKRANLVGADSFLSKPARRGKLLGELVAAMRQFRGGETGTKDRPWLAVLDDNSFVLDAWEAVVKDARVFLFLTPSEFWKKVEAEPTFLNLLDCVVTDYYFDKDGEVHGVAFAEQLKRRAAHLPVFLSSDGVFDQLPDGVIDARIAKDPMAYGDLLRQLKSAG